MNNFVVKPDMGVILNYFSVALPNFFDLSESSLWDDMDNICSDGQATYNTFYLFGAFDVLNIGISGSAKKLDSIQKIKSYQEIKGVMDFFIHYGIVVSLYPEPFVFNDAIKENPIIGIITIKIRNEAWEEIITDLRNIDRIKVKISNLFTGAINKTIRECPLNAKTYKAIFLLSYDCEDVIIILLTKSFQFIKRFTTNLRTVELKDIIQNSSLRKIKHIIASTNTILGVQLSKKDNGLVITYPNADNRYDKINWFTFFEIRPGHLQNAKNEISKIARYLRIKLQISPIVGRNDLIVHSQKTLGKRLNDFLKTHFKLIRGLTKNKSFISTETYISFPKLDKVESKKAPRELYPIVLSIDPELKELIESIEKSPNLHKLEKESFIQIFRKLAYLLEDRYLKDSFMTLAPIVFRGIEEYLRLGLKHSGPTFEILTGLVELCYATRYQGSPPIGETAVYPTLGYYSLGQKVLILLDYLGNWIIKNIAERFGTHHFSTKYIATININCPSGACIPIENLSIAFILLPPRPLFHPDIVMVIFFHELGHVIYDCFIGSQIIKNRLKGHNNKKEEIIESLKELGDIIAEFFSAKMLCDLDFDVYENRIMKTCLDSFEFEKPQRKFVQNGKDSHLKYAKFFKEVLDNKNPKELRDAFLDFGLDYFFSKKLVYFLKSIRDLEVNEVIQGVRKFLFSEEKPKEFWNLWILINSMRGECYYSYPKKSSSHSQKN